MRSSMDKIGKSGAHRCPRPRGRRPAGALLGCALAASLTVTAPAVAQAAAPGVALPVPVVPSSSTPGGEVLPGNAFRVAHVDAALVSDAGPVVVGQWPEAPSVVPSPRHLRPLGQVMVPVAADAGDRVRVGNLDLTRPSALSPELAAQITAGSGEIVRGISDVLRSNGVPAARADRVAEQMVGDAAVGGVIGAGVAAPLALAVGGVVGGGLGLLFGIPFLPTGLVVGPVVGTALVATLVALPAVAAGVAIGAAHGYDKGWKVPVGGPRHLRADTTEVSAERVVVPHQAKHAAPAPAVVPEVAAPVVRQVAPTPAVKRVEPTRTVGSGPADCSIVRKVEVALQGGAIGTCQAG
ncbi:hypothetical protein MHN80_21320 [Gordonia McavH-238-E]|uniref:hypothetical protein n=1 Tax=Gordonia sp. McavH-238-E TaxID=2917736 RepID=UPI001EF4CEC5|nr:hypothetical protein [Gordonia sp. McavH-238-E]MCG7634862.1 hypothetical protein [Gordonia sp. McavH-238-E]